MNIDLLKDNKNKSKEDLLKELKVARAELAVLEESKEARKRLEQETNLLKTLLVAISSSKDLNSALNIALVKVCETTKWDLGQAWIPADDGKYIKCLDKWYSSTVRLENFHNYSKNINLEKDQDLPGRILSSKRSFWIKDISNDANFPRAEAASKAGLKAAFGVPIIAKDEVIAVLEFFMSESKEEDSRLVSLISAVANQISTVIERRLAEEAFKISKRDYEALINSLDCIVWEADAKTFRLNYVSQQAESLLGYPIDLWTKEEHFWRNHIHPDDKEWAVSFHENEVLEKRNHEFEYRMIASDGRIVWLKDVVSFVVDNKGQLKLRGITFDITKRKEVENKLKENEELFRSIFENTNVGILLVGPDGNILKANNAFCNYLGYRTEELLLLKISQITHPEDLVRTKQIFDEIKSGKRKTIDLDKRYIRKDGSALWGHVTANWIFDSSLKPVYGIGLIQDITKRKKVEEEIKELNKNLEQNVEERTNELIKTNKQLNLKIKAHEQALDLLKVQEANFRLLFTCNPEPLLVYDLNTLEILEVSNALIKRYGYSREELVNMKITDIRPKEDIPKLLEHLKEDRTDLQYSGEWQHLTKNGEIIDVEITSHTLDFRGRKTALVIAKDITDRKKAEKAIKNSELQFRLLFSNNPNPMLVYDFNTLKILEANEAALVLYEYQKDDLLGKSLTEIRPKEDIPKLLAQVDEVRKTQSIIHTGEWKHITKSGKLIDVETSSCTLELSSKKVRLLVVQDITKRNEVEKALRESEEKFRQITENINEVFWVLDLLTEKIIYISSAYEKIWGLTCESLYRDPISWLKAIHTEDKQRIIDSYEKSKTTGHFEEEYRILKPGGEIRWIYARGFPIKNGKGEAYRMVGIAEDITKTKRAETKLQEEKLKYSSLVEEIPVITYLTKPEVNTGWIYISPQVESILGVTQKEWFQDPMIWTKLLHPEDRERVVDDYTKAILNSETYTDEYRLLSADSRTLWIEERANVIRDSENNPLFVQGVLIDVTKKKAAEEAMSCLSAIVEYSANGIIGTNLNGVIHSWNPGAERIYGYTKQEMIGESVSKLMATEIRNEIPKIIERIKQGERIEQYETTRIRKDGKKIYVSIDIAPVRNAKEEITGISSVVRDITTRKIAEKELNEVQRKLSTLINNLLGIAYRCKNDPNWTMEYISKGCYLLTEYKPEELINNKVQSYNSMIVPEDRELVRKTVQNALKKKEPYVLEYRINTKSGKVKWVWEKGSGVFGEDGSVTALEGFINDITERKEIEITRFKLASIVESSYDAIVSDNFDGIVTSWNPGAERVYGYKASEIIGKHISILAPPELKEELLKILEKVKKGETIENHETIRVRKDRKRIHVSITVSPIKDEKGNVIGICGIGKDITEQKILKSELELLKQKEQYETEIRSLEELANAPTKPDVAVQLFGITPLKKSVPGIFNDLVNRYEKLVERTLNPENDNLKHIISEELRFMGEELSTLKAGPSDVMEIYSTVIKHCSKNSMYDHTQRYTEKARLMILELMGYLVNYYRKQSLIPRVNGKSSKTLLL